MWAVELNNRLMLTEREAAGEEYRLLMRLSAMVRGYADQLRLAFAALVELDALNARAIFAERFNCVEPESSEDEIACCLLWICLQLATEERREEESSDPRAFVTATLIIRCQAEHAFRLSHILETKQRCLEDLRLVGKREVAEELHVYLGVIADDFDSQATPLFPLELENSDN